MNSMTGFGRGTASGEGFEVAVEVNSVNRRSLETTFSLNKEWLILERPIAEALKSKFTRGRLHTTVTVDTAAAGGELVWDEAKLDAVLDRMEATAQRRGLERALNGEVLMRVIMAMQSTSGIPNAEEAQPVVLSALESAIAQLSDMRGTEGAALQADLLQRMSRLEELLAGIESSSAGRAETYRELLMARLKQAGLELELEDERVLKEVAIFSDRCDITEEITRLRSHLEQFNLTIKGTEENVVGRKLEFILQEINREFNTIGSKSNHIDVSRLVIEAKNEIERVREQIQNVE